MSFLFDTSSLLLLIRSPHEERKIEAIRDSKVLDLTYYEIGNALWKESELLKILSRDELSKVVNAVVKCFENIESIKLLGKDLTDILDIARRERLSFYDSSFLYAAKKIGMTLVSEDEKLLRASKKHAKAQTLQSLL
ncbi:MAG TPA: type II toxin-antitoxin system VapC family toxin [Nitrososphaerales archaeon]|nr:type II toxin-antitoxin system VapC family toxin [Nitrososphaerales archaeon]